MWGCFHFIIQLSGNTQLDETCEWPIFFYIGKGLSLKTVVTRKESTPKFPKNKHFLPPDRYFYVCVSGGKKCFFKKNWRALFSCNHHFDIRPFYLISDEALRNFDFLIQYPAQRKHFFY